MIVPVKLNVAFARWRMELSERRAPISVSRAFWSGLKIGSHQNNQLVDQMCVYLCHCAPLCLAQTQKSKFCSILENQPVFKFLPFSLYVSPCSRLGSLQPNWCMHQPKDWCAIFPSHESVSVSYMQVSLNATGVTHWSLCIFISNCRKGFSVTWGKCSFSAAAAAITDEIKFKKKGRARPLQVKEFRFC